MNLGLVNCFNFKLIKTYFVCMRVEGGGMSLIYLAIMSKSPYHIQVKYAFLASRKHSLSPKCYHHSSHTHPSPSARSVSDENEKRKKAKAKRSSASRALGLSSSFCCCRKGQQGDEPVSDFVFFRLGESDYDRTDNPSSSSCVVVVVLLLPKQNRNFLTGRINWLQYGRSQVSSFATVGGGGQGEEGERERMMWW